MLQKRIQSRSIIGITNTHDTVKLHKCIRRFSVNDSVCRSNERQERRGEEKNSQSGAVDDFGARIFREHN